MDCIGLVHGRLLCTLLARVPVAGNASWSKHWRCRLSSVSYCLKMSSAKRLARSFNSWAREGRDLMGGVNGAAIEELLSAYLDDDLGETQSSDCKSNAHYEYSLIIIIELGEEDFDSHYNGTHSHFDDDSQCDEVPCDEVPCDEAPCDEAPLFEPEDNLYDPWTPLDLSSQSPSQMLSSASPSQMLSSSPSQMLSSPSPRCSPPPLPDALLPPLPDALFLLLPDALFLLLPDALPVVNVRALVSVTLSGLVPVAVPAPYINQARYHLLCMQAARTRPCEREEEAPGSHLHLGTGEPLPISSWTSFSRGAAAVQGNAIYSLTGSTTATSGMRPIHYQERSWTWWCLARSWHSFPWTMWLAPPTNMHPTSDRLRG